MTATAIFRTLREAASESRRHFELRERADGSRFWAVSAKTVPEFASWLKDLAFAAHDSGKWLPDDLRYEYMVDALDILEDVEENDTAEDEYLERLDSSVDIYTSDLATWLASHGRRQGYLDEVLDPSSVWAKPESGTELLQHAQYLERYEVFEAVRAFLTELVEG